MPDLGLVLMVLAGLCLLEIRATCFVAATFLLLAVVGVLVCTLQSSKIFLKVQLVLEYHHLSAPPVSKICVFFWPKYYLLSSAEHFVAVTHVMELLNFSSATSPAQSLFNKGSM